MPIKVVSLDKKHRKDAKLVEKYYNIATPKKLEQIRFEIFNPKKNFEERKKAFEKHKEIILKLKPIFKQLVIARNECFQEQRYKNYFEFATNFDGIPSKKLEIFFAKVDEVIKEINKRLPLPPKNSNFYWSEYNIPDPLSLVTNKKYSIPEGIYKMISEENPRLIKFLPRIKIVYTQEPYYLAECDKNTKTVIISLPTKHTKLYNALSFVHELGHAFAYLKLLDKGIDILSKSYYWQEKQAIQAEFEFEETFLTDRIKNASRGRVLGAFLGAIFEYEIYTNPNQDFDKLYAQTHNQCYPLGKQNENPFYVLENYLIDRPCRTVISAVATTESLLKRKTPLNGSNGS